MVSAEAGWMRSRSERVVRARGRLWRSVSTRKGFRSCTRSSAASAETEVPSLD